jgi:hypothetical protein
MQQEVAGRMEAYGSAIAIYFKSSSFFPFVYHQQLTAVDFASYCGGSLGLFLGFSVLSAVEIVYYFSVRILCFRKQQNRVISAQVDGKVKQKNYLVEAVGSSSIHGCNQIAMDNRHIFERIFWLVIVCLALVFCCRPTYTLFVNYQKSNIMMKYEKVLDSSEEVRNLKSLVADFFLIVSFI